MVIQLGNGKSTFWYLFAGDSAIKNMDFPINHVSILEDRSDFWKCKNLFDGVETVPPSMCDMGITWLILANPPRHGIKNAFGIIGCLATKRTAFVAERVDV